MAQRVKHYGAMNPVPSRRNDGSRLSRRTFIQQTLAASAAVALPGLSLSSRGAAPPVPASSPIVIFSKVYQELGLSFAEAANLTSNAGLDGVDSPVRPGGEVAPEKAMDDLPRYAAILREHQLQLPLLTTAITSVSSPHAESLLRTARKLGVQYYRLGFIQRQPGQTSGRQLKEVRAQLKDLAALNHELGIGALLQNHSPAGGIAYFGGNLAELVAAVADFDPSQIGVAFDIAHALVVHGDGWREYFAQLKPHFRIAYVKDVKRSGGWVPFGQGDIAGTGYFKLLRQMNYTAPISLHIEFDWTRGGQNKTKTGLATALRESAQVLRQWLAA